MKEPKAICELLAKLLADQQGKKIKSIKVTKGDEK